MLILAFDTATRVATSALVSDGEILGERSSQAVSLLEDLDALLRQGGAHLKDVEGVAVGTGPGSFTGIRIGLATARALSLGTGLRVAGVSTLDALAEGAPGALPVVDGGRREVFTLAGGAPLVTKPGELELEPGTTCVGDGALRYREILEAGGAAIPPNDSEAHIPRARFHAKLAHGIGPAELVKPLYLRLPDAEATVVA